MKKLVLQTLKTNNYKIKSKSSNDNWRKRKKMTKSDKNRNSKKGLKEKPELKWLKKMQLKPGKIMKSLTNRKQECNQMKSKDKKRKRKGSRGN